MLRSQWSLLLFAALPALAQPFAVGVRGGLRTTGDLEGSGTSESRRYLAGPMVQVRLPRHFAFEVDALYSRIGYTSDSTDILGGLYLNRVRANSWQFPLLVQYRLQARGLRFYPLLGYAPRHVAGRFAASGYQVDFYTDARSPFSSSGPSDYATDHALVAGAGVEFRAGRLHLAPELRYLRWKDPLFSLEASRGYYLLAPQDEVQILLGISWGGR